MTPAAVGTSTSINLAGLNANSTPHTGWRKVTPRDCTNSVSAGEAKFGWLSGKSGGAHASSGCFATKSKSNGPNAVSSASWSGATIVITPAASFRADSPKPGSSCADVTALDAHSAQPHNNAKAQRFTGKCPAKWTNRPGCPGVRTTPKYNSFPLYRSTKNRKPCAVFATSHSGSGPSDAPKKDSTPARRNLQKSPPQTPVRTTVTIDNFKAAKASTEDRSLDRRNRRPRIKALEAIPMRVQGAGPIAAPGEHFELQVSGHLPR